MLNFKLLLALSFALTAPALHAQASSSESTTKAHLDELKENAGQPPGEDVDSIITNAKLRADTGSKSKYSISASLGYAGGSLARPFSSERPNITGATSTTNNSSLGGSLSGKYNITTRSSVFGGFGFRWIAPLAGANPPKSYTGSRVDASDPSLTYQYLYNLAGLQSAFSFRNTLVTASDQVPKGYRASWGIGQNSVYEIGHSGFSVGFNTYIGFAYFDKTIPAELQYQSDYSWAFIPAVEYRLSDKWNLRMDSNLFSYQHLRAQKNFWTFGRQDVSQNFGVGYAATRDIYLSPGVSFVLGNLRADRTTWSFGATLNVF